MDKTEKRTAEDILDGLEQTDDGYIHYSKVLPAMHEYAAQERDKVRNQAIQDCIDEIERLNDDGVLYEHTARKVLESLKTKP